LEAPFLKSFFYKKLGLIFMPFPLVAQIGASAQTVFLSTQPQGPDGFAAQTHYNRMNPKKFLL
jgi:hypothetical protein